jgi:protein-tyrosine phosphatase
MIDLHTHILPGIDDGVKTDEEALEFARVAVEDGTRVLVATPHCKDGFFVNSRDDVLREVGRLREMLEAHDVTLRLEPGAEVHICPDLVPRIRDGRAPTLADNGKTLLLELSLTQYPVELENLVFQLNLAGIVTLFAHPERIRYFQDDIERYENLVRLGAYGQLTTGSILGRFGNDTRLFSTELLRRGLVHVVATDAHNVRGRAPRMREAVEAIVPLIGERRAWSMANEIPEALLEGAEPEVPPVEARSPRRRGFLGRWFRRS